MNNQKLHQETRDVKDTATDLTLSLTGNGGDSAPGTHEERSTATPTEAIKQLGNTVPGYYYDDATATAYHFGGTTTEPTPADAMAARAVFDRAGVSLPTPTPTSLPDVPSCPYIDRKQALDRAANDDRNSDHDHDRACPYIDRDRRCNLCQSRDLCIHSDDYALIKRPTIDRAVKIYTKAYSSLFHALGNPLPGGRFGGVGDPAEFHYAAKIIVGKDRTGKDVLTYITLEKLARPLTAFDFAVMNAIYSIILTTDEVITSKEIKPAQAHIPLAQIAQALSHVPPEYLHRHNPSQSVIDAIEESIQVLKFATLAIDYREAAAAQGNRYAAFRNRKMCEYFLPSKFSPCIDQHGVQDGIHVYDYCPLLEYSQKLRELTTIPFKSIFSPAHTPRLSIVKAVVEDRLLDRIIIAKQAGDRVKNANIIDWQSFCEETNLPTTQKEGTRARQLVAKLLDGHVATGFITSWKWVKVGRTFKSIVLDPREKKPMDKNEPKE